MTLSYDIQRALADGGGWMTVRQVCAVLDADAERPVRGGAVHDALRNLADRGRVERLRRVDGDDEYRLRGEPVAKQAFDRRRHAEYVARFPAEPFSSFELAALMGVTRQVASRHAMRAVEEGVLERVGTGTSTRYRRIAHER